MGVRNCAEVGENLQKIVTRLMANDDLVNLLYYTDKDPLSQPHLSDEEKKEKIFENLIKIVPNVPDREDDKSVVAIRVVGGAKLNSNTEFQRVKISVEVFSGGTALFIFISGFLFQHLSGKYEFKNYMSKKWTNVILPYLWTAIPGILFCFLFPTK